MPRPKFKWRRPVAERFWEKVQKTDDCWLWTASVKPAGYGQFTVEDQKPPVYAHRFSYEQLVGPIPDGLTLDHLCANRRCVNPDHLEPVPMAENTRRGAVKRWARARGEAV